MHFSTIFVSALIGASTTMAVPAFMKRTDVCLGTPGTPLCCAVDVLGVADVNCAPPPSVPTNVTSFEAICASIGQQAQCCVLPVLGQALVCESPP